MELNGWSRTSTSDHRVMVEFSDEINQGIQVNTQLFSQLKKLSFGIEEINLKAMKHLKKE